MKKINQIKVGAILSYMQMGIGVVVNIVFTPIMLRLLGQNEYGLYNTVASTISMLSILNLGFNSSYIRYYTRYKKEKDYDSIYRLNGLFLCIFLIIGVIALMCGLFLANNLSLVFDTGLTSSEYITARMLFYLLTVSLALSFPCSVFSNIISANERFVFLKLLGIIKNIISPFIMLPFLIAGYGSIAVVWITVILNAIVDICNIIYVFRVLKYRFVLGHIYNFDFKDFFAYTFFIAINIIINQINWNVDKMLLGRYRGTADVAIYAIGYTLYQCYEMFSTSISGVFTPRIHRIVNEVQDINQRNSYITELFIKVGRIQFLILGLVFSGFVFFGKVFVASWAGVGYNTSYYITVILMMSATVPLMQNIGIEIQRVENKHKFRSVVYLLMALFNFVLSLALCKTYGAIGCVIGTALSLIVANGFIMNLYYHKKCGIDMIVFWRNLIKMARGLAIPCIVGIVINIYLKPVNVLALCILIMMYTAIYIVSMWLFAMNKSEKALVCEPIKRVFRKGCGQ